MLESEAKTKLCPFKLGNDGLRKLERNCAGQACMGWAARTRQQFTQAHGIRLFQYDPPEGVCGMVPPELICESD